MHSMIWASCTMNWAKKKKHWGATAKPCNLAPDQATFCKNLADFYLSSNKDGLKTPCKLYLSVLEKNPADVDCL
jgi:hypothetical protein